MVVLGALVSQNVEIEMGCHGVPPSISDFASSPPGPCGEERSGIGCKIGCLVVLGCLVERDCVFGSLSATGDWEKKGSFHTQWSVLPLSFVR